MAYTTIKKPSDYFNTKLYTGNGSTQNITGVGFQPDWVWTKCRSTINSHRVIDAVRGVTKAIVTNSNGAEFTETNGLSAFGADGYTLNGNLASMNTNGDTYVSWNWKANGAGVANTDGSINSTVSVNATSGFSIVSYTGTGATGTIGHGLNSAPSCIITKSASAAEDWGMYHVGIGNTTNISLNLTNAQYTANSAFWNNTNPTSSVFTVGTHPTINYNTQTMIAYCFAEKKGYSKFGSYTGNGNADGTFVYTGFKPAMVIVKPAIGVVNSWYLFDNKRDTYNPERNALFPNGNNVETDYTSSLDFLSNGFKCRTTSSGQNTSGATYIYMAFAEEPLVGDNPCTAR